MHELLPCAVSKFLHFSLLRTVRKSLHPLLSGLFCREYSKGVGADCELAFLSEWYKTCL